MDKAAEFRAAMIEAAVEMDDDGDGSLPRRQGARRGDAAPLIRKATITRTFYPMMCGSAFKNKGVQPLLDAVVDFLPVALRSRGLSSASTSRPARRPCAGRSTPIRCRMLAFKIMTFPHVGSITFCRIYSGKLEKGMALAQTTRDKKERVGRMIYEMHAEQARGDRRSLCRRHRRARRPQGHPHRRDAVRPAASRSAREDGLPQARHRDEGRAQDQGRPGEDVAWRCTCSRSRIRPSASRSTRKSGETIIKGMGELHLDIKVDILRREPTTSTSTSARRRWPIARRWLAPTEIDYTHKKQTGGTGQFARVKLKLEPNETGKGNEFEADDHRRHRAEGIHPRRREGRRVAFGTTAFSSASRWST